MLLLPNYKVALIYACRSRLVRVQVTVALSALILR